MSDIITEIKNYVLFLKKECRLEISLHPVRNERVIAGSELAIFNIHENPYCVYVKTHRAAFAHCISRKKRLIEKCSGGSFCGTCYAGVREYIYPIRDGNLVSGFISVSGYRDKNCDSYIKKCSQTYGIPQKELKKSISELKEALPEKEYVDTVISPLLRMLELAYIVHASSDETVQRGTVDEIIKYVNRHYSENITLEHICNVFSRSRSCISHTFKKQTGKTFREYLIDVRLRSAKSLLLHSGLSVSEIAFSVGFNDSNYFSGTFKKYVGSSPVAFRKAGKQIKTQ